MKLDRPEHKRTSATVDAPYTRRMADFSELERIRKGLFSAFTRQGPLVRSQYDPPKINNLGGAMPAEYEKGTKARGASSRASRPPSSTVRGAATRRQAASTSTGRTPVHEWLELLRKTHEISFRSTVDLAVVGFQQLGLVHGGAIAGILAFIGAVKRPPEWALIAALVCFAVGLFANLWSIYYARLAQAALTDAHRASIEVAQMMVELDAMKARGELASGNFDGTYSAVQSVQEAASGQRRKHEAMSATCLAHAHQAASASIWLFVIGALSAAGYFAFQFRAEWVTA